MEKLKPCPFCGGEAKCTYGSVKIFMKLFDFDMLPVRIACKECGATIKEVRVSNKYCAIDLAAEEWNRRTDND